MKVIAVIEPACADTCLRRSRDRQAADRRPAVIRQILDHLGLASTPPSLRAPPGPPDALAAQQPREWSYEPLFDLPVRRTCLPSRGDRQAQTGDLLFPDPLLL